MTNNTPYNQEWEKEFDNKFIQIGDENSFRYSSIPEQMKDFIRDLLQSQKEEWIKEQKPYWYKDIKGNHHHLWFGGLGEELIIDGVKKYILTQKR